MLRFDLLLLLPLCSGILYDRQECLKSKLGAEYMGDKSTTISGLTCQAWSSTSPHSHSYTSPEYFPDGGMEELGNKCRNPDLEGGPWCYTTDPGTRWEFCEVPRCPEYPECSPITSKREPTDTTKAGLCKPSASCTSTSAGAEYVGKRSITASEVICQRWDLQSPHSHSYTDPDSFPDDSVSSAENYCRNPDGDRDGLWCYTVDPDLDWEYCDIPVCQDCKRSREDTGYAGTLSTTDSGNTCQAWNDQSPHPHEFTDPDMYPDASIEAASNYCRNPDGKSGGPWCFTTDPATEWEYCDLDFCEGDCEKDSLPKRNIKHVVHIGLDGLHADCWLGIPSPNIIGRVAEEGIYTTELGTTVMLSVSGPGWTGNICGMDAETSGVIANAWRAPWMGYGQPVRPITGVNSPMPCAFNRLEGLDSNIQTAAFYNWEWIYWHSNRGSPGAADYDMNCNGLGLSNTECDDFLAANVSQYLSQITQSAEKSYTFIHLDQMDGSGHSQTWCSEHYLNTFVDVDALVGIILDGIEAEKDEFLVFVSTDHGGSGTGHGKYVDDDLRVPLFMRGPGVKVGQFQNKVSVVDIVPTSLWAMGYEPSQWWTGNVLYEAFED